MRRINQQSFEATFLDAIDNQNHKVFWRKPEPVEKLEYSSKVYKSVGKKVFIRPEVRLEFGLKIMTGIEDAWLCDEHGRPITCFSEKDGRQVTVEGKEKFLTYREDWKTLVENEIPEAAVLVAIKAFDTLSIRESDDKYSVEIEIEQPEGGEKPDPFLQTSSGTLTPVHPREEKNASANREASETFQDAKDAQA